MRVDEIERLAADGESETLEFKRTTGERRTGVRAVCAMLNHRGGRVLFGVNPDGRILGQQVSDRTIEGLVAELREIDPPAFPNIDRIAASGGLEVVMVTVPTRPASALQLHVPPRRVEQGVTERQRAILALLADAPDGLALREIVPSLAGSATVRQIRDDLKALRVLGLAIGEGHGRGARWKRR